MQVVMLSDSETQRGAAIAATWLAEGVVKAGVRVTRLVYYADEWRHSWLTRLLRGHAWEEFVWGGVQRRAYSWKKK